MTYNIIHERWDFNTYPTIINHGEVFLPHFQPLIYLRSLFPWYGVRFQNLCCLWELLLPSPTRWWNSFCGTLRCTCRNSSRKWSYRPSCLPLPAANNRVLNSLRSSFHLHVSIISQSCNVLSGHGRELHSHQRESHCWWRPSQYFRAGRLNSKKVFWLLDNSETPEMIHIKFEWWTLCSSAETKIGDHQLMTRWWKFQKSSIPRLAIKWPSKLPSEPALSFISHMAVAMSVLGGVSCMELCKESILLLYIGDIRWCIGLRNYNALQLRLESSN